MAVVLLSENCTTIQTNSFSNMFRLTVHAAFAMLCIIVCSHVAVLGGHANSGSKAFKTEDTPMRIYIADSGKLLLIQTIVKGKINDCYMNNDKDIIEVAPEIFKDFEIKRVSQKEMNEVAKSCKLDKANWSGTSGTEAIDPGTKWCGIGNTAQNDDDLGRNRETDACCREHDKCPDYIKSGASKYGLKNKSLFLRSHCDCDDKFYSCLKNVNKWPSNIVGKIFFNLFQMKCFKNSHPVKMCRKFKGYIIGLALQIVNDSEITRVPKNEMHELVEICTYAKWSGTLGTGEAEIYSKMGNASAMLIYPGTKWCGAGNVSEGYDDLGPENETDACCREHDHCPDSVEKFGSKHGLDNNSPFTKSNCECDDTFYSCLRKVNVKSSNRVGKMYFNYLRMECFKYTHPIIKCKKYKGTIRLRCVEYELDETQDPVWQWFDAKEYKPLGEDRTKLLGQKQDMLDYILLSKSYTKQKL